MEHKHITAAVIALVLIIAGMFIFAYIKKNELQNENVPPQNTQVDTDTPYANITRIDAKHFYIGTTHTLVGEIPFPTPCDLLNWSTRIQESAPETAIVDFDVVNNADTCAQVVTSQRFKVSFDASKEAVIRATFEGRNIELNLIPAAANESPEDFELYIKG